ncbi:MAG: hypothetical protein JO034_17745, partial [Singulisphaera sp.]|nr:hypothetical protein [Singulisphaera sp.]
MEKDAVGYLFNGHTNPDIRRDLASRLPYRELFRLGTRAKLRNLDLLKTRFDTLDFSRAALERAAEFWAALRNAGVPTAGHQDLDADTI